MNYTLTDASGKQTAANSPLAAARAMLPLISDEKWTIIFALLAILANSLFTLVGPIIVGYTIDTYVVTKDYAGVLLFSGILLVIFLAAFGTSYVKTKLMGTVGQRVLFNLRNSIFLKLEELPVAFFNQNKAGDLISRINNDTDKLNQFFSQSLMQFVGNAFIIVGAGIFLLAINIRLGAASLAPALGLLVFTQLISAWVKRKNLVSLQTIGGMSSEIQESLNNFRVIVAFNRRDYFRDRFQEANEKNFTASVTAGLANNIFTPTYGFISNLGQLIVLTYGIALILGGNLSIGLLISYLAYVNRFYDPLRQMASFWSSFQLALAAWDRISAILSLKTDMAVTPETTTHTSASLLEFKNVSFGYTEGKDVLHDVNFTLQPGKTYALVGPTGGGKTTTASLMARLYDPTAGTVLLSGKDIRSYEPEERTKKIGFILQEPFLFSGTVRENILYGNAEYAEYGSDELLAVLKDSELDTLLVRFEKGLDTDVRSSGDGLSLGQRQLIAFMRAVLRHPDLLILDEATANIDTVT